MIKAVYIHIPFCKTICTYCDFTKVLYNKKNIDNYLNALAQEIDEYYQNEIVKTIYIGGGTPSLLELNQMEKLLKIVSKINHEQAYEYTFECNIESIDEDKMQLLKKYGVNRISVGIQTMNSKYLHFLGRNHSKEDVITKIAILKRYFDNINVDMMYAFKGETIEELRDDLDAFISLNVNHISTYSLIIEPHTVLYINGIKPIDEDLEREMYDSIIFTLKKQGYIHYEISNFSRVGYNSIHNLTYWNNEHYYGFGLGASGYIKNVRYQNTANMKQYLIGNYRFTEETLDINDDIINALILGLRKIDGINKNDINSRYGIEIDKIMIIKKLVKEGKLIDDGIRLYINYEYIYISNSILVDLIGVKYV